MPSTKKGGGPPRETFRGKGEKDVTLRNMYSAVHYTLIYFLSFNLHKHILISITSVYRLGKVISTLTYGKAIAQFKPFPLLIISAQNVLLSPYKDVFSGFVSHLIVPPLTIQSKVVHTNYSILISFAEHKMVCIYILLVIKKNDLTITAISWFFNIEEDAALMNEWTHLPTVTKQVKQ